METIDKKVKAAPIAKNQMMTASFPQPGFLPRAYSSSAAMGSACELVCPQFEPVDGFSYCHGGNVAAQIRYMLHK